MIVYVNLCLYFYVYCIIVCESYVYVLFGVLSDSCNNICLKPLPFGSVFYIMRAIYKIPNVRKNSLHFSTSETIVFCNALVSVRLAYYVKFEDSITYYFANTRVFFICYNKKYFKINNFFFLS